MTSTPSTMTSTPSMTVSEATASYLEAATTEYERLAIFSDAYSKLSHAVSDHTKRAPLHHPPPSAADVSAEFGGFTGSANNGSYPKIDKAERINAIVQSTRVPLAASTLFQEIQNVREAHLELHYVMEDVRVAINEEDEANNNSNKSKHNRDESRKGGKGDRGKDGGSAQPNAHQRRLLRRYDLLKAHTQLSQRVVKTVCSAGVGIPLIYANGLIATEEADVQGKNGQHRQRIVALAALRASIARIKESLSD